MDPLTFATGDDEHFRPVLESVPAAKHVRNQLPMYLQVTLLNLKVVTTYAKALVETLAEKPNRVIFSANQRSSHPRQKF